MAALEEVRDRPVPITLEESIQLGTLAYGEVEKRFPSAMKQVIANIIDTRRPAKGPREINVKVKFEPNADRAKVKYKVTYSLKLQDEEGEESEMYIVGQGNEIVVTDSRPDSPQLSFK
jgi:hypothetical protein